MAGLPRFVLALAVLVAPWASLGATVTFEFKKGDKRFPLYSIPEAEKAFTVDVGDVRRLTLPGEKLAKPIIVRPKRSTSVAEPWDVLARYLEAARTGGTLDVILSLYDEPSQKAILAMPPEIVPKAMALVRTVDAYEFWLVTYRDDFIVAYGNTVQNGEKMLTHVTFRRIGQEYRMIAGVAPFSQAYDNALMNLLADHGFEAAKGDVRK